LYNGYDYTFWYWEFVVVMRNVVLVAIAVYFVGNQHIQALLAILLVTVALIAHAAARPFDSNLMDWMEFLSLISSFGTFFCGQFLFINNLSYGVYVFVSVMVLLVNVGYFVAAIVCAFLLAKHKINRITQKRNEREEQAMKLAALPEIEREIEMERLAEAELLRDQGRVPLEDELVWGEGKNVRRGPRGASDDEQRKMDARFQRRVEGVRWFRQLQQRNECLVM